MHIISKALLVFTLCVSIAFGWKYGKDRYILYGDSFGYYSYLPATFVYNKLFTIDDIVKDTTLGPSVAECLSGFKQGVHGTNGYSVIQYTYGIAAMNSPAFFITLLWDKLNNTSMTGYELRYQQGVKLMGLFYLLFGLLLLYKSLVKFYERSVVLITLCLLVIGTNIFWFSFYQIGMAHINLFFLNSLLLFATINMYDKPEKAKYVFLVGLALALIALIRPSDIVVVLIPLLFGLVHKQDVRERISLIKKHGLTSAIICLCIGLIVFLPQLYYWKKMTGNYFVYSYGNQSFNWLHPEIFKGLFGSSNGWLIYTPIMILSIMGLLTRPKTMVTVSLYFLFPLYIYIIYSWWCYNYINGFGSRPMIHLYPYLALPMAGILIHKNFIIRFLVLLISIVGVVVNLNFSYKAANDFLRTEDTKYIFNASTFFKQAIDLEDLRVLDLGYKGPKDEQLYSHRSLLHVHADTTGAGYITNDSESEYSNLVLEYFIKKEDLTSEWIGIGGMFRTSKKINLSYKQYLLTATIERMGKQVDWFGLAINNKIGKNKVDEVKISTSIINQWGDVHFHIPTEKLLENDKVRVVVWNAGKNQMDIKYLYLKSLNRKN